MEKKSKKAAAVTRRIAIVGGGIAGLYSAYRLSRGRPTLAGHIDVFEASDRFGGRILSQVIPGLPFRAELGAMRVPQHHKLAHSLLDHLGIDDRRFDLPAPMLYVRGRHLSLTEVRSGQCHRCGAVTPFVFGDEERGLSATELVRSAISKFLTALSFSSASFEEAELIKEAIKKDDLEAIAPHWRRIRDEASYQGTPVYGIGFWNLLQHYLTGEAFQFVQTALGLDSVIGNWNAAEAIPWFDSDFAAREYRMVPGGFESLIDRLRDRLERRNSGPVVALHQASRVERLQWDEVRQQWHLWCKGAGKQPATYDEVVMALPRQALESVKIESCKPRWPPAWINWVRSHRLYKLFLLYEKNWWRGEEDVGAETARLFTDLPLRQIYYFGSEWMKRAGRPERERAIAAAEEWSLVMVYNDEEYGSFWHPSLSRGETQGEREEFYGPVYSRRPSGITDDDYHYLQNAIPSELRAGSRMVQKVQKQLREIHGEEIVPEPILGVFKDWGTDPFGGGWHTWEVGRKAWEIPNRTTFCKGLHLCGEVFSSDQGWMEGALKTAEAVLDGLGAPAPTWWHEDQGLREYIKP